MKVLIVDDSLLAEHAIKSYFTKLGHEVVGMAKNGELAKEMIDKYQPDIVTVDAVMPGIHGVEVVKYINDRDRQTGSKTRIFMISSDEIKHTDKQSVRVDKYILKPITMNKIKQALEEN